MVNISDLYKSRDLCFHGRPGTSSMTVSGHFQKLPARSSKSHQLLQRSHQYCTRKSIELRCFFIFRFYWFLCMLVIVNRSGDIFSLSLEVTRHVDDLLALVGSTVLASRMGQEWCLTGGAHTNILRFHGIMSSASANA